MVIGVPKETLKGETRVALIPQLVSMLVRDKHEIVVETGAGDGASHDDAQYTAAGARIAKNAKSLFGEADMLLKVQPPTAEEAAAMKEGASTIGFLAPASNPKAIRALAKRNVTAFSMEYVPRITRAQSMDALSSMATIAGYKAVLLAADNIGKMFPLLMTAAGTVPPATVMILGAGVAGLQAIATARRLGAKVEAFDVRAAVKEQVKSLGAAFIEIEGAEDLETAGGYAKAASEEFLKKQRDTLAARFLKTNIVITTAQVFGKKAPILITKEMMKQLKPGSVVVDLAAEQGGNCELTEPGKTVEKNGVTIIGAVNLPATIPVDASLMYSKNVFNLFKLLYPKVDATPDFNDEIVKGACITRGGEITNESVRNALQGGSEQ
ncbi:MAG: Re/Si-specific NAD(P)(+) transhydrogenase subunit alpha [Bacteroidetes bacterium]|nr:Re/Si-specific NAD(P)(+) transhydrogenase subunit alpha [Bacteroidota bacterium]MCW5895593.1 Re/Si-specific NAD(P)(+) transhydrogenase subunit alpha [Bacteroidota bacterium]